MKSKLNKQKQKEKADIIFNYIKNLPPFSISQERSILDKNSLSRLNNKEPQLVLSSRVFQMNVNSNKSKKRVTFLEVDQTKSKLKNQVKKRAVSQTRLTTFSQNQKRSKVQNPEQIYKDLLSLQKNIYQKFRIDDRKTLISTERLLSQRPSVKQINKSQKLQLLIQSRIKQQRNSSRVRQSHLSKSQSQRLVKRNSKECQVNDRNESQRSKLIMSKSISANMSQQQRQSKFKRQTNDESFAGVSKSNKTNSQPNQNSNIFSANRSQGFWEQQNNLMVVIFKKKLEGKFNLTARQHF